MCITPRAWLQGDHHCFLLREATEYVFCGIEQHGYGIVLNQHSGADIKNIVKEAMKRAFVDGQRKVTQQDLQEIIRNTKSSYQLQKEKLDKMLEKSNSLGVKPASR